MNLSIDDSPLLLIFVKHNIQHTMESYSMQTLLHATNKYRANRFDNRHV